MTASNSSILGEKSASVVPFKKNLRKHTCSVYTVDIGACYNYVYNYIILPAHNNAIVESLNNTILYTAPESYYFRNYNYYYYNTFNSLSST